MYEFGSGRIILNPVGGNLATNPTPEQGLTLQDFSLDMSQELVELRGQYQFPDDVAPSDRKITGKFMIGNFNPAMLNQVLFADTVLSLSNQMAVNEAHSIPATSPYTITATNSATFSKDLGVIYAGAPPTGNTRQLARVTGSPASGQYSVSAGVYTFAAADEGYGVLISYVWVPSVAVGTTQQVNQQVQGWGPVFEAWIQETYQSTSAGYNPLIHLTTCRFSKLSLPFKRKGYMIQEFEYQAYANAAGLVMELTNPGLA